MGLSLGSEDGTRSGMWSDCVLNRGEPDNDGDNNDVGHNNDLNNENHYNKINDTVSEHDAPTERAHVAAGQAVRNQSVYRLFL